MRDAFVFRRLLFFIDPLVIGGKVCYYIFKQMFERGERMAENNIKLCEERPHVVGFHRAVEGSLQRKFYPVKPQGRISDGFIYILEGKAHYTFQSKEFDVARGEIILLSRGSRYSIDILSENYRFIFADFDFAADVESDVFHIANAKGTESVFRSMLEKWRQNKPAANEECVSLLYHVYAEIVRTESAGYIPSAYRMRLEVAAQFIADNFSDETLDVKTIAIHSGMSETHFRRLFKEAYHMSPVKYLTLIRISRAKELIRYTAYQFSQIALETGFSNLYYFSRIFKKEVGVTPSEYRAAHSQYQEI